MTESSQVKILLDQEDHVETVWADPLGADRYRVDNSPFWAYGISWHDVIEARPAADGMLTFVRVCEKSGHRTLRLILNPPSDQSAESRAVLDRLISLGASYEGMNHGYLAINIPPNLQLERITDYLESTGQKWESADPPGTDLEPDTTVESGAADV